MTTTRRIGYGVVRGNDIPCGTWPVTLQNADEQRQRYLRLHGPEANVRIVIVSVSDTTSTYIPEAKLKEQA